VAAALTTAPEVRTADAVVGAAPAAPVAVARP